MNKETATLMREISAFEKQLEKASSPRRAKSSVSRKGKIANEIKEVERLIAGLSSDFMDESGMDEDWMDEVGMDYMEDDIILDDEDEVGMDYMDDDIILDDEDEDDLILDDEDEVGMDYMDYMDDDIILDDEDEVGMDYMDDDLILDDEDEDDMDYMDYMDDEVFASEIDPSGVEEDITDDHYSEVSRITDNDSISDAQYTHDVVAMRSASRRLDRLASYIEGQVANHGGNKEWLKVAYRIDQMADSIDARIKSAKER